LVKNLLLLVRNYTCGIMDQWFKNHKFYDETKLKISPSIAPGTDVRRQDPKAPSREAGPYVRPVTEYSIEFEGVLLSLPRKSAEGGQAERTGVKLGLRLSIDNAESLATDLAVLSLLLPKKDLLIEQLEKQGISDIDVKVGNKRIKIGDVLKDARIASEVIAEHIKTYLKEERKKDPNRVIIAMLLWLMFQQIRTLYEKEKREKARVACITTTDLQELLKQALKGLLGKGSPLAERYLNETSKSAFLRLLDEMSKAKFIMLLEQSTPQKTSKQRGRRPKAVLLTPAGVKYLHDILSTFASIGLISPQEPAKVAETAEKLYGKEFRQILK